jgi:hypothetical protein
MTREEKKLINNLVTMGRNKQQQTCKLTRGVRGDAALGRRVDIRGDFIKELAKHHTIGIERG